MATELSRVDRLDRTYNVTKYFPDIDPADITVASLALLPVGRNPNGTTVWFPVVYVAPEASVTLSGPDADSTGALAASAHSDLWMKVTTTDGEVDAAKVERVTVLGGGTFTAPASIQALIGLDTDGVPFYDPGGIGTPAGMALDLDGVPYFTP